MEKTKDSRIGTTQNKNSHANQKRTRDLDEKLDKAILHTHCKHFPSPAASPAPWFSRKIAHSRGITSVWVSPLNKPSDPGNEILAAASLDLPLAEWVKMFISVLSSASENVRPENHNDNSFSAKETAYQYEQTTIKWQC